MWPSGKMAGKVAIVLPSQTLDTVITQVKKILDDLSNLWLAFLSI